MTIPVYEELVKKHGFSEVQKKALGLVRENSLVLEIGCSSGYITRFLAEKLKCKIDAVEKEIDAAEKARKFTRRLIVSSIEDKNTLLQVTDQYDYILLLDVLEHLTDPEMIVKSLRKNLKEDGEILASTPNIASWPSRKDLFFKGKFEYEESGLFDRTHIHFFTYKTFIKLFEESGLSVTSVYPGIIHLPFQLTLQRVPIIGTYFFSSFYTKISSFFPNLGYFHFLIVAKKK